MADISSIQGYPTISWSNDVFNVWLAQNKDIVNLQVGQETSNYNFDQLQNLTNMTGALGQVASLDIVGGMKTFQT